jgi:hypothetical protein
MDQPVFIPMPPGLPNQTEYQIHIKESKDLKNISDFTEKKIEKMIQKAGQKQKIELMKILSLYQSGQITISWKNGITILYKNIK